MNETVTIDKARWERLLRFVRAYVGPCVEGGDPDMMCLNHSADGRISAEQWEAWQALQDGDTDGDAA